MPSKHAKAAKKAKSRSSEPASPDPFVVSVDAATSAVSADGAVSALPPPFETDTEAETESLESLAILLGGELATAGLMLVTAESCTGGMIAAAITDVSGSSAWFERGYVTYSNDAKFSALGVSRSILDSFGAVSEEVAGAMAIGALAASFAQVSVAVTGVAGPGGGTETKPVGMVCFGWQRQHDQAITETCHFKGDRAAIRRQAAEHGIKGVRRLLAIDTDKSVAG